MFQMLNWEKNCCAIRIQLWRTANERQQVFSRDLFRRQGIARKKIAIKVTKKLKERKKYNEKKHE